MLLWLLLSHRNLINDKRQTINETPMKQFELKFYKEWYDALSELSHEDRAAAVLALLEYVYEGKLPENKFIRIVITLMRNRIDREKTVHTARQARLNSCKATKTNLDSSLTDDVKNASPIVEPSEETTLSNPTEENASPNSNSSTQNQSPVLLSDDEAKERGIDNPERVNQILRTHFNPFDDSFRRLCAESNVDPLSVAKNAKRLILQWISYKTWYPVSLPPRSKPSVLNQIDSYAFSAAKAFPSSPSI